MASMRNILYGDLIRDLASKRMVELSVGAKIGLKFRLALAPLAETPI